MLGVVLFFIIGKTFYSLAKRYNEPAWLYGVLGIVTFFIGVVLGAIGLVIIWLVGGMEFPEDDGDEMMNNLVGLISGLLACIGVYRYLQRRWKKHMPPVDDLIDEIGTEETHT